MTTAQVEQTGYKVICACAEEGIAQVKDGARREEEKKGAGKGMSKHFLLSFPPILKPKCLLGNAHYYHII